jgi:hypothetical protein
MQRVPGHPSDHPVSRETCRLRRNRFENMDFGVGQRLQRSDGFDGFGGFGGQRWTNDVRSLGSSLSRRSAYGSWDVGASQACSGPAMQRRRARMTGAPATATREASARTWAKPSTRRSARASSEARAAAAGTVSDWAPGARREATAAGAFATATCAATPRARRTTPRARRTGTAAARAAPQARAPR